jgi:hypothetical protein
MGKFILAVLLGLIIGGVLTFYFFVGVPSGQAPVGEPILPPDAAGNPPGTAQIVLNQGFFNSVLGTILRDMNPPAFPLGTGQIQASSQCNSQITILPEGSGTQTALRFSNGAISVPLAFSGSYSSPFGCMQFTGWAQSNFELRFDAASQIVYGRINVETVNLDGVNPIVGALVTPLVQSSLNTRVNPIQILDGRQIALSLPIAASNANLQATVKDVRAEVRDDALNLYVVYGFSGAPFTPPQL